MNWISVDDRTPEKDQRVLVYSPVHDKIMVCEFKICSYDGSSYWRAVTARDSSCAFTWRVTHWMPLPEIPKEV